MRIKRVLVALVVVRVVVAVVVRVVAAAAVFGLLLTRCALMFMLLSRCISG